MSNDPGERSEDDMHFNNIHLRRVREGLSYRSTFEIPAELNNAREEPDEIDKSS